VNTALFVVLLVVGILALLVLIWIPILVWLRRRSSATAEQLSAEIEGESILRAPEKGSYRGSTAPGFPAVKNTGLIALTQRRLVFRTLTGHLIEVPVESITGVREAAVFKGSVVGGQTHLIVQTSAGEIGFYVFAGIADWTAAITELVPGQRM
jgi:Tfp pilus assembly protein PilX